MTHIHESNTGKIWKVFGILSLVTVIEVILGIYKPAFLHNNNLFGVLWGLSVLNILFYALTVYKAHYIVYSFMHMEGESTWLRRTVVLPFIFLLVYLLFILLTEGHYIFGVFKDSTIKWNF